MGLRVEDEDVSVPILRETERVGQARFGGPDRHRRPLRTSRFRQSSRSSRYVHRCGAGRDCRGRRGSDSRRDRTQPTPDSGERRSTPVRHPPSSPAPLCRRSSSSHRLGINPKNPMRLSIGEDDVAVRVERQPRGKTEGRLVGGGARGHRRTRQNRDKDERFMSHTQRCISNETHAVRRYTKARPDDESRVQDRAWLVLERNSRNSPS